MNSISPSFSAPLRPLRFSASFAMLVFNISGKAASQGTQRTAKNAERELILINQLRIQS